jgi:4-alpha-glucanotransferase
LRFERASGVLLHPTCLPGPHGSGDLGPAARHFIDWLVQAGQKLWQILPLTGIGAGNSPYTSASAFAGNVLLVDLAELQQQGWLEPADVQPIGDSSAERIDYAVVQPYRMLRLALAAGRFFALPADDERRAAFAAFCELQRSWLDDYSLFMALHEAYAPLQWPDWPAALAGRDPEALAAAQRTHDTAIRFWKFAQWNFFRQWRDLKAYANQRDVQIIGDVPIFIAHHSAEVWANPALFMLDAHGAPTVVAGVPPDFFSATGQRWGNPLYRWSEHAKDDFAWWVERLRRIFELVDIVRVDHFRGFAGYWEIPAAEATAVKGHWRKGPGAALFKAVNRVLGPVPIIAEDLGEITPDVEALRRRFKFPGMRVLQFAFGGDASNPYLPHRHEFDSVVYPGTHDNDTSVGWWAQASEHERHYARAYLGTDGHDIAWSLIRCAMASVADTAIVPMQDILALPGECRMNKPGEGQGWWEWRLQWQQVHPWHAQRLAELCRLFGRDGLQPAT